MVKDGFVGVAACTPDVRVADVSFNVQACYEAACEAAQKGARVIVLPELCITGYSCADLFMQDVLLNAAEAGIAELAERLSSIDALVFAGLPLRVNGKLYNCAAALSHGAILGIVPKRFIPSYNEFYEGRYFMSGPKDAVLIDTCGYLDVPFGTNQLFRCETMPELIVAAEICEDLWVPNSPSIAHAIAGATLICNLSASDALVNKARRRRELVSEQSARVDCAYVYASAGWHESTQDLVFSGHDIIAERGSIIAEARPFEATMAYTQVDIDLINADRRKMSSWRSAPDPEAAGYLVNHFTLECATSPLTRRISPHPFVPTRPEYRAERCEEILAIQAHGLARRLEHIGCKRAVIGISGGLDSTLALLVCAQAFDIASLDRSGIEGVTMPGFGTTGRTYNNARQLVLNLGASLREVDIRASVVQHLEDIGHNIDNHDVVYENAQARERTQILMDIANQTNAIVVGTGDLSELALGWATFNGDHMSMYGVNASIPKTLVRYLVEHVANTCGDSELKGVLEDILNTPVSPELLPPSETGEVQQITEDLVGPYELHDFFIYYSLRYSFAPHKVFRLACYAFDGTHGTKAYDPRTILHWMRVFYRRFFAQQFKRSTLPDGPKVGPVTLSPRGDWRMPSDAVATIWLRDLDEIEANLESSLS